MLHISCHLVGIGYTNTRFPELSTSRRNIITCRCWRGETLRGSDNLHGKVRRFVKDYLGFRRRCMLYSMVLSHVEKQTTGYGARYCIFPSWNQYCRQLSCWKTMNDLPRCHEYKPWRSIFVNQGLCQQNEKDTMKGNVKIAQRVGRK